MGASIHLVGDSINHRLLHLGYQNHLPLEANPLFANLHPPGLLSAFQLLYFYDEHLGHLMWYLPYMLVLALYFTGCFQPTTAPHSRIPGWAFWGLLPVNILYYWYLATEGQIVPLFLITTLCMLFTLALRRAQGKPSL